MIWFTSDTHFGAERTLNLSKRPFKSVSEMNDELINNWNNVVAEDDIVYHLGDFGDYTIIKQLKGRVVLVYGNYERRDEKLINNLKDELLNMGFYKVIESGILVENMTDEIYFNMSHEPSKHKEMSEHLFNVFGHIHKLQMIKPYGLNVGTDAHNYTPIDLDTVLHYRNAILNFFDDEVFY